MLLPLHIVGLGLRTSGLKPVEGSILDKFGAPPSDTAEATRLRMVQQETAELRGEMAAFRETGYARPLPLGASVPPPTTMPPAVAVGAVQPCLHSAVAPSPSIADSSMQLPPPPPSPPPNTAASDRSQRPNMMAIVPSIPPTLRKTAGAPNHLLDSPKKIYKIHTVRYTL
jgi:hypothetical protein